MVKGSVSILVISSFPTLFPVELQKLGFFGGGGWGCLGWYPQFSSFGRSADELAPTNHFHMLACEEELHTGIAVQLQSPLAQTYKGMRNPTSLQGERFTATAFLPDTRTLFLYLPTHAPCHLTSVAGVRDKKNCQSMIFLFSEFSKQKKSRAG